jgi:Zn-dependent peptidase ImmA (M78 family)
MLPEEKIAQRFSEKRGIKPPVPVEVLVRELADLEEDFLPAGYDAVTLDRSGRHSRPRVIIETRQSATRRIVTLGHELGHLVIPWHKGTHFCRVDGGVRLVDRLTAEVEAQANHFTAELLMPAAWIEGLIRVKTGLAELIEALKFAGVSCHAASIRLIKLLPAGFLFTELDSEHKVVRASASAGTWIRLPVEGLPLAKPEIDSLAREAASFKSGSSELLWWRLPDRIAPPKIVGEEKPASEVLGQICEEVFSDDEQARLAKMSINGVIGAANGTNLKNGSGDLFAILKQRFLCRREIAAVVAHKLFDEFLIRRVREIENRYK